MRDLIGQIPGMSEMIPEGEDPEVRSAGFRHD